MTSKFRELNLDDLKNVSGGVAAATLPPPPVRATAALERPMASLERPMAASLVRPEYGSMTMAPPPQLSLHR